MTENNNDNKNATATTATTTKIKGKSNPLSALTAGCIAGAIEATAVWPMEYIKVRINTSVIFFLEK